MYDAVRTFLSRYCPEPKLIEGAIERLNKWGIADYGPDKQICSLGDAAEACWIIVSGKVEISCNDRYIATRSSGEMIGEQAFITTLLRRSKGVRSADMIARGSVKLVCLDAAFQEQLAPSEATAWALTLAAVVNDKLLQSTTQRVDLSNNVRDRQELLHRFVEGDALTLAQRIADGGPPSAASREVIVWFSDIQNFSHWAAKQPAQAVSELIRRIATIQIEQIRSADGQIDKLMGDGLMAIWFIDTAQRKQVRPSKALNCAIKVQDEVRQLLASQSLSEVLDIRIGMHCGPAVFGDFGAKDRIAVTVIGDTVNVAARYEQAKDKTLPPIRISGRLRTLIEQFGSSDQLKFIEPIEVEVKHGLQIEVHSPDPKGA